MGGRGHRADRRGGRRVDSSISPGALLSWLDCVAVNSCYFALLYSSALVGIRPAFRVLMLSPASVTDESVTLWVVGAHVGRSMATPPRTGQ